MLALKVKAFRSSSRRSLQYFVHFTMLLLMTQFYTVNLPINMPLIYVLCTIVRANFLFKHIDSQNTVCKTLASRSQLELNNFCQNMTAICFFQNCLGECFSSLVIIIYNIHYNRFRQVICLICL